MLTSIVGKISKEEDDILPIATLSISVSHSSFCTSFLSRLPRLHLVAAAALGPIQGHKVQHLLVAWGRLNFFSSISAWIPSVKSLGPISACAPIGMLDLG